MCGARIRNRLLDCESEVVVGLEVFRIKRWGLTKVAQRDTAAVIRLRVERIEVQRFRIVA